ncbi:adenylate cyclase [Oceanospirillum multiglobuliferum]|uniref:Guanylate cyclase domain-containing protein n=1 Tax=Oceanospirillum multiglobuliferum TaxID=64969 RepID=A0A1T4MQ60_9GAMM|nr:adenylate/guanylate cyclase domain-containing protein [Oceanospirillum multiglobuliferum]OPX56925.1 hypothetical protein BTE48_00360 [Oceanospirillum multiglobuliferum]SJZ69260.1 adenylate cyclase [Oceanospirillum multiglobuliferum]
MTKASARRLQAGTVIFLTVCTLMTILHFLGGGQRLEWITYDHRYKVFRADKKAHDDIAIILIDESSLQAMAPLVGRFPWPRTVYTDLLEFLNYAEPKAILFDILFTEHQNAKNSIEQEDDLSFAIATASTGSVYHAAQIMAVAEDERKDKMLDRPLPDAFKQQFGFELNEKLSTDLRTNNYALPYTDLYSGSRGIGSVDMKSDADGIYRTVHPFRIYQDKALPSLGFAAFVNRDTTIRRNENSLTLDDIQIPLLNNGEYPVHMVGKFNTYSFGGLMASLQQIRQGNVDNLIVDPREFTNKIIYIGASAVGLEDIKATPVLSQAPGVMIHASITSNILERDFLEPASPQVSYILILLFALLASASVLYFSVFSLQILLPAVLAVSYVGFVYWQFSIGELYNLISPVITIILASGLSLVFLTFTEGRDKQRVRKMLSQYVSPAILTELIDKTDELAKADIGTVENLTILFSDIRGFTSISENLDASQVVDLLNIHLGSMSDVIFDYNGTLDKFIGDAIMAFWGAPIRIANHPDQAVQCALAMVRELTKVNEKLNAKGYKSINVGIGLHTGDVVLGNIGSSKKLDYTVIGDNVNLASRMEGLTKNYRCEVLITEDTVRAFQSPMPCIKVDLVRVKGKQHPTAVYIPTDIAELNEIELAQAWQQQQNSEVAFEYYLARDWDRAIELFKTIRHLPAIDDLIERCNHYKAISPDMDWDGVHTMNTK